ncbi:MAG: hypothetical protein US11_C0001G0040 [Candidatus Roizmanbacteria bacterium GW2011_GWA2_36_23]|uniref:RmuC-domain protein n=1 Tax=Candidatus Roizmanbacteria bacterium GW2011_GWA2_36_23 TaxID=1618480 RepID=A0A0G0HDR2_9BACT|nr:MAG: hypothetical protein US11_C0001G0040 [Candidatus Roizmanbacteria bacterium GW2011_GWA2_36_23]
MEITLFIVIATVAICLLVIKLWLNKIEEKTQSYDKLFDLFTDLGRRIDSSSIQIDHKLTKNIEMFNTRLDKAAFVIAQVQKSIGEFSEIGRSMSELQQFLQSPKLRGNIGEHILKELLSQYFPKDTYKLQYEFKNGEKVDAVIKTTQGLIPIDSKFPFSNFRKMIEQTNDKDRSIYKKEFCNDVKKHIQDIAKKYILAEENTCDYALMYIPSESVYYEIINETELFDFSGQKRVLPVSPLSFYAYMKAILMSFEGQRIQTQAKQILDILNAIKKDYEKSEDSLSILGKHITNAYNQMSSVTKNFVNLGQKLSSTHLLQDKKPETTETEQKKLIQ